MDRTSCPKNWLVCCLDTNFNVICYPRRPLKAFAILGKATSRLHAHTVTVATFVTFVTVVTVVSVVGYSLFLKSDEYENWYFVHIS